LGDIQQAIEAMSSHRLILEKVLRECEDELAFSLRGVNTQELCDKFFERCLLSSESYTHFTSLDHKRLQPQLQVKYLVRLARVRVKTDQVLGKNLIEILDPMEKVPSSLTEKLKQAMMLDDSSLAVVPRGADKEQDIIFTSNDQNILTELLVTASPKWEEICISLGIPEHEISFCRVRGNDKISLFKGLGSWLANSSNPTMKNLAAALRNKLVNETSLANSLEKKVKKNEEAAKVYPESKKPHLTPRILSQTLPTGVDDGKSTLLQVLASPRESVSYQWYKDGQPLANSCTYSGVYEDILVVRHASQGTEGKYTCRVSLQNRHVTSDTITLTVQFPLSKQHLINMYSSMSEVSSSKNSWPPVVSKIFINLALVKIRGYQLAFSVQGNADDIIAEREKVEYSEVFGEYKSGELILVEGKPGSGKTTLGHKLVKDWAAGRVLVKARLAFFVSMRVKEGDTLSNFLQDFIYERELKVTDITRNDGEGVCFVIDGFDELQHSNEKSVLWKLLHKTYLPRSMIVLFSRPTAIQFTDRLLINKRIEVFGFSKEQLSEYIDNFPFDEEGGAISRATQLKDYLSSHPNIHDMCYLPIHAAMVCFIFQFAENVSFTQTEMYLEFTRLVIQRHLARQSNCMALVSLKDLNAKHAKSFKDLCHLAYEMTIRSKQVVCKQDLQVQLGESGSFSEEGGLGLLTINPTLHQTGFYRSYSFLHLTFQEFLAAYYIANYRSECLQMEILQENPNLKTVWLFYSGLVDFLAVPERLEMILSLSSVVESFHYALESQQKVVCDGIIKRNSGDFYFLEPLSPSDMLSIGYGLSESSEPIKSLTFANHPYGDNQTVLLLRQIGTAQIYTLTSLEVSFLIGESGTGSLCELLQCAGNIDNLVLNIKHILSSSASSFACQINRCGRLSRLALSYSGTPECIKSFVSSLQSTLTYLHIFFKALDKERIQALGEGLVDLHANNLFLKISASSVDEDSLTLLVGCLQHVQSLHLDLSRNNIDSKGISRMALECDKEYLHHLSLSSNNIGSGGAVALAEGLKFMTKLETLDLSHNHIGSSGASAIAEGLKNVSRLKRLDLSRANIGSRGATELVEKLHFVPDLKYLDISLNNVEPSVAKEIKTSLKKNKRLDYRL